MFYPFLHFYEKLPQVLPVRNVTQKRCYLYEMLPIQAVNETQNSKNMTV